MWLPIIGLIVGIIFGSIFTFSIPVMYAKYMGVALLAGLDSVLGGVRSIMEDSFDGPILLTGFFTNILLAAFLAYVGDRLGVELYLAAVFAFGVRLFHNLAAIRRIILNKFNHHL
ncbi:MAG: small basic family protein [Clostridia bacterium]|nr:small basic family protein [Clostridia bacterium]